MPTPAARATREQTAIRVSLIEGDEPAATERRVRAVLDTRSLSAAWRDGERATFEDLLDLAMDNSSLADA